MPGPPRQRNALRHRLRVASRYGASPHSTCAQEESMKIALSFLLTTALVCAPAPSSYDEPRKVIQGTQVHLTLLTGISTAVARDGDPFVAIVADPVYLGSQLLLPAGTRLNGIIGTPCRCSISKSPDSGRSISSKDRCPTRSASMRSSIS